MVQFPKVQIEGIKKCFVLYVKFPKDRWGDIHQAEQDTTEGRMRFAELSAEYLERYSPSADSDPHGVTPMAADLEYGVASVP